jgi:hypothetical protein
MLWTLNHRCSNRAQILWQRLFQQYQCAQQPFSWQRVDVASAPKADLPAGAAEPQELVSE